MGRPGQAKVERAREEEEQQVDPKVGAGIVVDPTMEPIAPPREKGRARAKEEPPPTR